MPVREDVMLWLDLETTGSSPEASVLEVGLHLTDMKGKAFLQNPDFRRVIYPRDRRAFLTMDPVVIDMHLNNGLVRDVMSDLAYSIERAELDMLEFLEQKALWRSGDLIPLAGSGVSHFDRQFIRRDFPRFNKRLTYYAYDVGVIRRTLRQAGLPIPDSSEQFIAHRALEDAKAHAEEYARYMRVFERISPEWFSE